MLPISDSSSPESQSLKIPKTPDLLKRKNSFSSIQPYLSLHHPRTWFIVVVLSLQIFLLLMARSGPASVSHRRSHFPAPTYVAAAPSTDGDSQCGSGKVYVYDLPPIFNTELLQNCSELNPWVSRCEAFSNGGFGPKATGYAGIVPENLTHAWYWTDQFASEIIYHNRIMNYRCRTTKPESATAFYIPFYGGLALGKYLWRNYSAKDRDRHCEMMLRWVQNQPFWNRSNGWDHFTTMGRITWDFRRSNDDDWGSRCIYLPGMRNITRLLIERNQWDYFDVGVPYPTGFHPWTDSDVVTWQDFVRTRKRNTLYCFAGATRGFIKNDFRGVLLSQCYNESGSCRIVNCGGSKCANGSSAILETFLDSNFCLQPRGDSFTRRSIFDCMVAGSIPVFFWKRTAYYQYEWFLPGEPESYSVFIDRNAVENGTSIRGELEKIGKEEVRLMREKVIEYIPKIVYAKPNEGLVGIRDAFDVAMDGVLSRIKEQEGGYKW
ncbi:Xyloglucan galactosyltransferase [Actinidia chinensis var. chinensis]|uniref:Xyloglucan galactosyltransferase n=1 Tax=Actinidia chinensis var. chinensis TaxID=1590841 RepID=A0A2R6RSZ9_ACTCC|nr:Xyloglucan galactosyltransferase [Actinidia chinensis var. chinensis]